MKIITFSTLYPNNVDSTHGIFVERRLLALRSRADIQATVLAPVPWFPFRGTAFGRYGRFARIVERHERNGIEVLHPRYPLIPKIGMSSAPFLMARAMLPVVDRLIRSQGPISLLDAHYFYPDGVAAGIIARHFDIPLLITARGTDVNLLGGYRQPRRAMVRAAETAGGVVAVSAALGEAISAMGIPDNKIHVLRNGVDLDFFCQGSRAESRQSLGIRSLLFLSVGTLKPEKGHDVAIRMLARIDDAILAVIGAGDHEKQLVSLAGELGVSDRVRFTGRLSPEALREYYRAADALLLMSVREGMPNVVLESMACGTPVVATDVGGIPELVEPGVTGYVISKQDPDLALEAWAKFAAAPTDRSAIRDYAERFSWDDTIVGLHRLMRRCVAAHSPVSRYGAASSS